MKKFLAIVLSTLAPAALGLNAQALASSSNDLGNGSESKTACIEGSFVVRGYHDTIARYVFRLRKKADGSVVFQSKVKNPGDPFSSDQKESRVQDQFSNDVLKLKRVDGGSRHSHVFRSQDERFQIKVEDPKDDPRVSLNYFGFEVEGTHIRKCK